MRVQEPLSLRSLPIGFVIAFLLALVVGCEETMVSPRHDGKVTDVTEGDFLVGDGAVVQITDFVGRVTWRTGGTGTVHVKATRRATSRAALEHIGIDMLPRNGGLDLTAKNPEDLDHVSVDFDVIAPEGVIPHIATAVGDIDYTGRPRGQCRFATGVGNIRLRLPEDVDVTVELRAAVGSIFSVFPVEGSVSTQPSVVHGRIGRGDGGALSGSSAVGNIYLKRW